MESLLDRSEADNRGVKKTQSQSQSRSHGGAPGSSSPHTHSGGGSGQKAKQQSVVMAGEANKKGGIFDRLTNQSSYTGVRACPDRRCICGVV